MSLNPQFSTDLVAFTEEFLNGELHFLRNDLYFVKFQWLLVVTTD